LKNELRTRHLLDDTDTPEISKPAVITE
jgi:hypothetical protein